MSKLNASKKRQIDRSIGAALFSDTERMEMWFNDHWKSIAVAAVALVLVLTAIFAAVRYHRSCEAEATHALQTASTIAELTQVLEKHSGNIGAPYARFRLAHKFLDGKEFEKAASAYRQVIADPNSDPMLAGSAKLQLAYLEEISGDARAAAKRFAEIGDDVNLAAVIRAEADYGAARLFLDLGDVDAADRILGKNRQNVSSRAVAVWYNQLDFLQRSVKNGDFRQGK